MATKAKNIELTVPVEIAAAKDDGQPARFSMVAYNGGELDLPNFDMPVIVDLNGAAFHKSVKANLNHDRSRMVGHVDVAKIEDNKILMAGAISGGGEDAEQVLKAHKAGYPWEASIQANRLKLEVLARGKTATVNGQQFTGPKYIARQSSIYAVAFCDQGADDSTEVTIAATAASKKGNDMKAEIKAWAEGMGIDVDNATPEAIATIEANYEGRNGPAKKKVTQADGLEGIRAEAKRKKDIIAAGKRWIETNDKGDDDEFIGAVQRMIDVGIEAGSDLQAFRNDLYESALPVSHTVSPPRERERGMSARVLEAALCESGRLNNLDKQFTDQELQAAHDRFPQGISLNEMMLAAARHNGYSGPVTTRVTQDIHNAAYGFAGPNQHIRASGFSPINISNVVAATANKFMHEGWMSVDTTPLRIAAIRSVRNFQQITTVSLTGHLQFEKVGADGELKHGALADLTYTNQADTYGLLLAITRKDYINDDQGCLTAAPRRMGRGGALKLNDIFWTEFLGLVGASFFASGNSNINTGVADMTLAGMDATETIFLNQTDPDGKPVGFMPRIILVPPALSNKARAIASPLSQVQSGNTAGQSDVNTFAGRFRVETSPYISNSSYTGYTSVAWWMLADPQDAAVIEICALNGRVEPTVETTDAAFNVLGSQMRGYSDIGVNEQEKRAGVHADGGTS